MRTLTALMWPLFRSGCTYFDNGEAIENEIKVELVHDTDESAENYNQSVEQDDGSCVYAEPIFGCQIRLQSITMRLQLKMMEA